MQDWNYVFTNTFEITFELSCCKYPTREKLAAEWERNREAMIWYMQQVHRGVKGLVKDAKTGKGIYGARVRGRSGFGLAEIYILLP